MTTPVTIRRALIDALRLDLVGPEPEDATHERELLPQEPSRWYLTGFLVPREAPEEQRRDDSSDEELDVIEQPPGNDEDKSPEKGSARKVFFPSSMGLSTLIGGDVERVEVDVDWGTYSPEVPPSASDGDGDEVDPSTEAEDAQNGGEKKRPRWRRTPHERVVPVDLALGAQAYSLTADGLRLVVSARPVVGVGLPKGTRSVSFFLVNDRKPGPSAIRDETFVFQGRLRVRSRLPLVARPDGRSHAGPDEDREWDDAVADLQYRDDVEYASGHNISARATLSGGACHQVETCWVPEGTVEKVDPAKAERSGLAADALEMEGLADAAEAGAAQVRARVSGIVEAYGAWIEGQAATVAALAEQEPARAVTAEKLLGRAEVARKRIADGLAALDDPQVLQAFRIANLGMARYARQRFSVERRIAPEELDPPAWRLFQLAFVLMNLRGLADPKHVDRELVDLLFFPTGGGKTEAYLGLAAFTLVLRRLRNPGLTSAGVSVLMRYTLRLLTLDQLGRAAALICALELMRQENPETLGEWPFEIGLWVGLSATPNRIGHKGDKDRYSARTKTNAYANDDRGKPPPIPLEKCPWCGTAFNRYSFQLLPNNDYPSDLRVFCARRRCAFNRNNPLPIVSVDEPLYRRLPCFVIATIDKFAGLPWVGRSGALFGKVERYDEEGFYGACDPKFGRLLPEGPFGRRLPPPDLVIQDELHLISGPLGTMAGLYETAIDALSTVTVGDRSIRPKIIASTATVRRASRQIQALFGRSDVAMFPPPGPDRRDSFFAQTKAPNERNPRLYLGVAAQGRSLKVVLMRTYLALMATAQRHFIAAGGAKAGRNPADPYMTLVGYFNSLRELGGSRRIVEDEVSSRLRSYGRRRRLDIAEGGGPFARRKISDEPLELTSRVETNEVAEAKRRLEQPFSNVKERVDVALATNMISVGLDIVRLGLMVVLGQPKTASEYIQATSRVGRDVARPGLVVTLLNIHRPRDRSHYERFESWHSSFYRAVEATSVTPFSPRALDRGLAPVVVALARHGLPTLTEPRGAGAMVHQRKAADEVADILAQRAEAHERRSAQDSEALRQVVRGRAREVLDAWEEIANRNSDTGGLQYQREVGRAPPLLWDPMDPDVARLPDLERKFTAPRSLRDVEGMTNLWIRNPNGQIDEGSE